ncbi:MAG: hypothetical protein ACRD2H_03640 [Terriglobales bacterium]
MRLPSGASFALRSLRRAPGFSAAAILTVALGIGANTAFFAVIYAVLLRPLPFPQPQQLVYVWSTDASRGVKQNADSYPDFRDWRRQAAPVFSGLSAIGFHDSVWTLQSSISNARAFSIGSVMRSSGLS